MGFKSDYYYGNEASQYIFYRIPKMLFTEPYFCKMSNDSKILYGLMLDRMGIFIKNNWRDENNRVYIYYFSVISQSQCHIIIRKQTSAMTMTLTVTI